MACGMKPTVCFEVVKVIGVSMGSDNRTNYQVQWAPVWVSDSYLVGCERLIEEFLHQQTARSQVSSCKDVNNERPELLESLESKVVCENDANDTLMLEFSSNEMELTSLGDLEEEVNDTSTSIYIESEGTVIGHFSSEEKDRNRKHDILKNKSNSSSISAHANDLQQGCSFQDVCEEVNPGSQSSRVKETKTIQNDSYLIKNYKIVPSDNPSNHAKESYNCGSLVDKSVLVKEELTISFDPCNTNFGQQDATNTLWLCRTCHQEFEDENQLRYHEENSHPDQFLTNNSIKTVDNIKISNRKVKNSKQIPTGKCFKCETCSGLFKSENMLRRHRTNNRCLRCWSCGKTFLRKNDLERHLRVHTGEKPYGCPVCGKCFTRKFTMQKHISLHGVVKEVLNSQNN